MILVTGGTGFVGRHLVSALLEQGDTVRVFTRAPNAVAPARRLEIAHGDLSDRESVARALRGVSTIVHLAARLGKPGEDANRLHELNVRAAESVAIEARRASVERFLHVSSGGVYGDGHTAARHRETDAPNPGNAYERSKLAGEVAVRAALADSGVRCLILRPAGIYGPGREATRAFFDEVRTRKLWLHGSPNAIVHPTHVSDVVQACVKTLRLESWTEPVMNVAGAHPLRFQDFIDLTARTLGVRARQLVVPTSVGRPLALTAKAGLALARAPIPATVERLSHRYINRSLDTSLATRVLDFAPIDLERALRQTADSART